MEHIKNTGCIANDHVFISSFLITLALLDTAVELAGISSTIIAPAPILTLSPIFIGPMITALQPNNTLLPISAPPRWRQL